jgi:hypothetical protein
MTLFLDHERRLFCDSTGRDRTWFRHPVSTPHECVVRAGQTASNLGRQPDPKSRARRGVRANSLKNLSSTLIGSHFAPQIGYDRCDRSIRDFQSVPASLVPGLASFLKNLTSADMY